MIVTRFAPSPTGFLHIGGLRTALYCYLWARSQGGKFLLRIEDTDMARNSKEAAEAIVEAFKWVGLQHDGEIVYQSERFDLYKTYVQRLLDEGKAYYCYLSKEELDTLRESQMANKERPRYDGRYRDFTGTPPQGIAPVVRIKAPLSGKITFVDGVKGEMCFEAEDILDDFIIARSDGSPTYNFCVTIDDALMGVTDVIRGDDHLSNTPKQIIIYEALDFKIPTFFHVPMILNPEGKKLSKRDGATDVMEYEREGFLPESLLNFLVRLGWSHGDQEIFSLEEMLTHFDPHAINKSASAYNYEKLLWLNHHYIQKAENARLFALLIPLGVDLGAHPHKERIINLFKERAKTLKELARDIATLITPPQQFERALSAEEKTLLASYAQALKESEGHLEGFEGFTKAFLEAKGLKLKELGPILRLAMVGSLSAPAIFEVLECIGYEGVLARITTVLE